MIHLVPAIEVKIKERLNAVPKDQINLTTDEKPDEISKLEEDLRASETIADWPVKTYA